MNIDHMKIGDEVAVVSVNFGSGMHFGTIVGKVEGNGLYVRMHDETLPYAQSSVYTKVACHYTHYSEVVSHRVATLPPKRPSVSREVVPVNPYEKAKKALRKAEKALEDLQKDLPESSYDRTVMERAGRELRGHRNMVKVVQRLRKKDIKR